MEWHNSHRHGQSPLTIPTAKMQRLFLMRLYRSVDLIPGTVADTYTLWILLSLIIDKYTYTPVKRFSKYQPTAPGHSICHFHWFLHKPHHIIMVVEFYIQFFSSSHWRVWRYSCHETREDNSYRLGRWDEDTGWILWQEGRLDRFYSVLFDFL